MTPTRCPWEKFHCGRWPPRYLIAGSTNSNQFGVKFEHLEYSLSLILPLCDKVLKISETEYINWFGHEQFKLLHYLNFCHCIPDWVLNRFRLCLVYPSELLKLRFEIFHLWRCPWNVFQQRFTDLWLRSTAGCSRNTWKKTHISNRIELHVEIILDWINCCNTNTNVFANNTLPSPLRLHANVVQP